MDKPPVKQNDEERPKEDLKYMTSSFYRAYWGDCPKWENFTAALWKLSLFGSKELK
jgi:hypothetical protein